MSTDRSGAVARVLRGGGRVVSAVVTALMAALLMVFVAMTALRFSGGELLVVRTGSMVPTFAPGDLLVTRDVDPRTVQVGDVVTVVVPSEDNQIVTHRVVDREGSQFRTRGDANATDDPFLTDADDVLGREWFTVDGIGHVMVFLSSTSGTALLIGVPALLYGVYWVLDRRAQRRAPVARPTSRVPEAVGGLVAVPAAMLSVEGRRLARVGEDGWVAVLPLQVPLLISGPPDVHPT